MRFCPKSRCSRTHALIRRGFFVSCILGMAASARPRASFDEHQFQPGSRTIRKNFGATYKRNNPTVTAQPSRFGFALEQKESMLQ